MGNYQTTELYGNAGSLIAAKSLDLSKKLTPEDYIKHTEGNFLEGSLESIPSELIYYDSICMYEEINLSFNYIPFIPEEFSLRVPHLRVLSISHNQLTGLPYSFHLFLHLRVLDLSFNKIKVFPEPLVHLRNLHTLNISHNDLSELPSCISKLSELQRLNISWNHIRALPESLLECLHLEVIVAIGNSLIHPPQSVCDLGSSQALLYLAEKRVPATKSSTVSPSEVGVFTRVRGQQVMASVVNPESASREYKQAQGTSRSNKRKCPLMVPSNATSLAPDQLRETILGLVYGACIGDAFGLNVERLSRDECRFFYFNDSLSLSDRIRDSLRSYFAPNDWSSNADIMLLTMESFMRWGGVVDELELAALMVQWKVEGLSVDPFPGHPLSPLIEQVLNSESYAGFPHYVAEFQYKTIRDEQQRGQKLNVNLSDNSCLPAAVILGIPNFNELNEVVMNAERACKATHSSPLAVAACIFTSLVASYLLQGKFQKDSSHIPDLLKDIKLTVVNYLKDEESKKQFERIFVGDSIGPPNDVSRTIQFILSALTSTECFEDILAAYMNYGQEGISAHCCVVGGIIGAYFGYSQIPQKLLQQLPDENKKYLSTKLNHLLDLFGLP